MTPDEPVNLPEDYLRIREEERAARAAQTPPGPPTEPMAQSQAPPAPGAPQVPPQVWSGPVPAQVWTGTAFVPKHPQATTSMVLGIVSLAGGMALLGVPLVIAPFAWVMGARAEREIIASQGRLSGLNEARTGKITGIIGTVLLIIAILLVIAVVALLVTAATTIELPEPSPSFEPFPAPEPNI